jgi:uncharacterized protein (TIGR02001 family)
VALAATAMALSAFATAPAGAQIAGSVTLSSTMLFRGESVSADRPAVTLAATWEGPAGLYAGGDIAVMPGSTNDDGTDSGPRMAMAEQYAGIARRVGVVSLEVGAIHRDYARMYDEAYRLHFTEIYVGVSHPRGRLRLYVSPDYLRDGRTTYYLDGQAPVATLAGFALSAHAGLSLIPHDLDTGRGGLRRYADIGLTATRKLGRFDLAGGVAATNYPVFGPRGRPRAFVAASISF